MNTINSKKITIKKEDIPLRDLIQNWIDHYAFIFHENYQQENYNMSKGFERVNEFYNPNPYRLTRDELNEFSSKYPDYIFTSSLGTKIKWGGGHRQIYYNWWTLLK